MEIILQPLASNVDKNIIYQLANDISTEFKNKGTVSAGTTHIAAIVFVAILGKCVCMPYSRIQNVYQRRDCQYFDTSRYISEVLRLVKYQSFLYKIVSIKFVMGVLADRLLGYAILFGVPTFIALYALNFYGFRDWVNTLVAGT